MTKATSNLKLLSLVLAGLLTSGISAQAREFAEIYTDCGLGALIAPHTPAVAAVTNVTWDLGTTAISSNVSSPDTCKGGQAKTAAFIFKSYESLEKEIAMGNGKYLDKLIELSGSKKQKEKIIRALRKDFSKEVASNSYAKKSRYEKSLTLYNILYSNV
ncbi:DUF3015 family protein [Hydrogenimonas sp.]